MGLIAYAVAWLVMPKEQPATAAKASPICASPVSQ
jgi:hypothetical protein